RRPPQRHAGVARQADPGPDLEARGLCPLALRPAEQGRGLEPRRCHERDDSGDADAPRAGAQLGHRAAMIRPRSIGAASLALLLGGCQSYQSIFSDAAVEVRQFNTLFVIFLAVCAIMYVAVIAMLIGSLVRRRRAGEANVVEAGRHHQSDPLMQTGLIGWGSVVLVGLTLLAIASFFADRSMARAATNEKLSITLTANQWWWDVTYNSADASKTLRTANELHL